MIALLVGVKWYLTVVLICISWILRMSSTFSCVHWLFVYLPWKNIYSDVLSIFKLGYLSFYYWVVRVLYSRYKSLFGYLICKNFPIFYCLSFHFLDSVFWSTRVFNFHEVQFIFSFVACAFGVISKNPLANLMLWRFIPMFPSKNFIVLALTFFFWCGLF